MTTRVDQGCGTARDPSMRNHHERLIRLFAPVVRFHSAERFFPVDLPTTVAASALWEINKSTVPANAKPVKDFGLIQPQSDLPAASGDAFTTVAGFGSITRKIEGSPPLSMPAPEIDAAHKKYTDGSVPAELTIYGMVCGARDVPNAKLFDTFKPTDSDVANAIAEGFMINYYMYFPARESPEFESEGDWSGISLLFRELPEMADLEDPQALERRMPVLTCYFRKTVDGAPPTPHFVAGYDGIRKWKHVNRVKDTTFGVDSHPIVFVSRGRHNCYYETVSQSIPLDSPWGWRFDLDKIENGSYSPSPAGDTLDGGAGEPAVFPFWSWALAPELIIFEACAAICPVVEFDSSGIPSGYEEGQDDVDEKGYKTVPPNAGSPSGGSSYPKQPATKASAIELALKVVPVDLSDATTAAIWGYPGAWGAASLNTAVFWSGEPGKDLVQRKWGDYQGARRPKLAAWCLWNIFHDTRYGSGGQRWTMSPTSTPGP